MRMKKNNKKKGMTLIEIVVSIALIGIIAVSFLSMFVAGFKYIVTAGNKSKTIYISQDEAENKQLNGASISTDSITVHFQAYDSHDAVDVTLPGEIVLNGSTRMFVPQ